MSAPSPLAAALAALAADPAATPRRLALHAALAEAEVVVWLEAEAEGDSLAPRVFPVAQGPVVLAFDGEAALAAFAGPGAPYAALPGRVLVRLLAERGLGLMLQAEGGLAELMPQPTLAWLARQLAAPAPRPVAPVAALGYGAPALPEAVVAALEWRLATVPGLTAAVLASVRWAGGAAGQVLALAGVAPAAEAALARALLEAAAFAGAEGRPFDVVFPQPAALAPIAAAGRALRLAPEAGPENGPAPDAASVGPGMDPARPPRLR